MGRLLMLETAVVKEKFRHYAGAHVITATKRLVVHLVGWDGHLEVILVQGGRRPGVEEGIHVANRFVWAVALLEVKAGRVRYRGMHHRGVYA